MNSQDLIGEKFYIDNIIGMDQKSNSEFILREIEQENEWVYGNTILFKKDNTFICSYSSPCGVDCFPSSDGTYELIDGKHIKLFIRQFRQQGFCEEKNIMLNLNLGTYSISETSEHTIKLTLNKN